MKKLSIDERRSLMISGDKEATLKACVEHFIDQANRSIKDHGLFSVALSGGSTPKAIYQKLATPKYINRVDWSKVAVFFSDERSVAPDNPDSNYKMAMDSGFSQLPLPKEHIHRMQAEENIEENALSYEKKLLEVLGGRAFDYIMLGMGDDGHTASLFPGTDALNVNERLVTANYVPQKETWRMTFTYPLINSATNIVLYVLGEGKAQMLKRVLLEKDPENALPSSLVGTAEHPALWIADDSAAKLIVTSS